MSNSNKESNDAVGQSEVVGLVMGSECPPDIPHNGGSKESVSCGNPSKLVDDYANQEAAYYHDLDCAEPVHSHKSLQNSRAHCVRLLSLLPDQVSKTEMTRKLIDQEVALQESIRNRDYSDQDMTSKTRRGLVYLVGYGCFLLAASAFAFPFFYKAQVGETFKQMIDYSKWISGSALISVVLPYYFPRINLNMNWPKLRTTKTKNFS